MARPSARNLIVFAALAAASAFAQPCPPGRTITNDTLGHCCWPGQVYATSRGVCVGVPTSCPTGYQAKGESCEQAMIGDAPVYCLLHVMQQAFCILPRIAKAKDGYLKGIPKRTGGVPVVFPDEDMPRRYRLNPFKKGIRGTMKVPSHPLRDSLFVMLGGLAGELDGEPRCDGGGAPHPPRRP